MTHVFSRQTGIYGFGGANQPNCDMLFFNLKTFLKANGWSVAQSCDGTTVNSAGTDVITSAGSGAGGMNNSNSWFVLQAPLFAGRTRQFCFHKSANSNIGNYCRMITYSLQGYSTTTGYGGSAISATNPPIAFDGIRLGNYIDGVMFTPYLSMASGSFTVGTGSVDHNYWNFASPNSNANFDYWNYLFYTDTSTGSFFVYIYDNYFRPISLFGYDCFSEYDTNDPDPTAVINMPTNATSNYFTAAYFTTNTNGNSSGIATSWFRRPTTFTALADSQPTAAYYQVVGLYPVPWNLPGTGSGFGSGTATIPATSMTTGMIQDQYTKAIPVFPMYWGYNNPTYSSGVKTIKGKSNFMQLTSNPKYSNVTLTTTSLRNLVSVGDTSANISVFILPWDGTVPLTP
jgi:hypothetical protein